MGSIYEYTLLNSELSSKVNKKKDNWSNYWEDEKIEDEDNDSPIIDNLSKEADAVRRKMSIDKRNTAISNGLEFLSGAVNWMKDRKGSSSVRPENTLPPQKKDNTLMYVGIGVGVIALGTGIYFLTKK